MASSSPRRIEFFEKMGVPFTVRTSEVEEVYPEGLAEEEIVRYLSRIKAEAAGILSDDEIVVGADTIVWADSRRWASRKTRPRRRTCSEDCPAAPTR